ncbi:MAG: thiamine pyrophosphate-binding protein [Proteobacteria bacterium]|nr:thiamine pyrophosphate-binding protein [Pseudomonadota bacterium]
MPERATVGDVVAAFLERCRVATAFGVISIHNMPMLDALGRRARLRFVPARGEAGALAMADAYGRVGGGLGVAITSTGTGAANAAGAQVEAETAGTPVLHLTGQIETAYLDRGRAYIHEARDQRGMLRAISKRAYRVWSAESALGTLKDAVRTALTAPRGPVSVEIPIDVQETAIDWPADLEPLPVPVAVPSEAALDRLADALASAKRPLLWLGGGARHAGAAVQRLVALGFGVVTSVQGRGVIAEDHPMTLGAFNLAPPVEAFYATCDALLVVGSRLRGNETLKYTLKLPQPLYQIDADPAADGRAYPNASFVAGDAALALAGLAERLASARRPNTPDTRFAADLAAARTAAEAAMARAIAPYDRLVAALQAALPGGAVWVRDITLSNSMWGNRRPTLTGPRDGVHALGGGIGLGLPMAIGAALAASGRKTVALIGDGGLMLNLGELATAVQERADLVLLVMNDGGYGVIRNIQDAHYGGRRMYADLYTPDFAALALGFGVSYRRLADLSCAETTLRDALAAPGPTVVEVDMIAIGPFASAFAGPPVRKA